MQAMQMNELIVCCYLILAPRAISMEMQSTDPVLAALCRGVSLI